MPQSDDRALCFEVHKPISPEGYSQNFLPRLDAMLDAAGEIRLLIYFSDYKGWETEAAIMDMGAIAVYGAKVAKFAMVNPPKKEIVQYAVKKPLIHGEIRIFEESQLQEAVVWVKE
jgi:hypothetical protein